jgi:hypothetical protein
MGIVSGGSGTGQPVNWAPNSAQRTDGNHPISEAYVMAQDILSGSISTVSPRTYTTTPLPINDEPRRFDAGFEYEDWRNAFVERVLTRVMYIEGGDSGNTYREYSGYILGRIGLTRLNTPEFQNLSYSHREIVVQTATMTQRLNLQDRVRSGLRTALRGHIDTAYSEFNPGSPDYSSPIRAGMQAATNQYLRGDGTWARPNPWGQVTLDPAGRIPTSETLRIREGMDPYSIQEMNRQINEQAIASLGISNGLLTGQFNPTTIDLHGDGYASRYFNKLEKEWAKVKPPEPKLPQQMDLFDDF